MAVLLFAILFPITYQGFKKIYSSSIHAQSEQLTDNMATAANTSHRLPTYFLGIGGPNFIENTNHPAYLKLIETGKEITTKVKPKAVVVFSAHWQEGPSSISVNVVEDAGLIYDFYGFPPHYYEIKYPHTGSPEVAEKVVQRLAAVGIKTNKVNRGLDHGVWVGFLAGKMPAPHGSCSPFSSIRFVHI